MHRPKRDGLSWNLFQDMAALKAERAKVNCNFPNINQQAAQMDEVAECIVNDIPLRVTGDEGLKDMIVVDAVHEAIKSGRKITMG